MSARALNKLLADPYVTLEAVTEQLNALSAPQREASVLSLGKSAQKRLWELAASATVPVTTDYFLPADFPPLKPVPFEGKNSLPIYTRFQKVFYRTSKGEVAGFNNYSLSVLIGPGYYTAYASPHNAKELCIDYTQLPSERPPDWAKITENRQGLARFFYGGLKDYLRWVSPDVVIGKAFRNGAPLENYFILVRGYYE
jgi:hypothetical protein